MNKIIKMFLLVGVAMMALPANAQTRISGTVSDAIDVIIGANVKEVDKNNRTVNACVTDFNGNFTMSIKDRKNNLVISYIGMKTAVIPLAGKTVFKITLQDNVKTIKEVQVTAKKMAATTGLDIPAREFAGAVQKFDMADLDGLAFTSVDEALQGQIAGLDIVANSGNAGAGTTMRLRGTSTLNAGSGQPLIVVNDHIQELPEDAMNGVDWGDLDNEEQFSTLLNVNPEDIESITVLKDGAAAKWGAKGSNGVIEIKLKRGKRGPTSVTFNYKFTGTWQPSGYRMLNGDEYTMYMKESLFNPKNGWDTEIPELEYPKNKYDYIYNNYNKNTDWVGAVNQFGAEHHFYVTLSGGGEKATFRIGAGYDTNQGTNINQSFNRFSTTTALDYWISDRIKFSVNMPLTFSTRHNNSVANTANAKAYKAMPNMSIYEWQGMVDEYGNPITDEYGNQIYAQTNNYFNMLPVAANLGAGSATRLDNTGSYTSWELRDMFSNGNPIAYANYCNDRQKTYDLHPQFSLEYKLLGKESDQWRLNYVADVQLDIYNKSDESFTPSYLTNMPWVYGGDNTNGLGSNNRNYVSNSEYKSLQFSTRHDLRFYSAFKNKDHSLSGLARFEIHTGNSNSQYVSKWNLPDGVTDPTSDGMLTGASAGNGTWRGQSFYFQAHYSYKSKYNLDASVRIDGSTNFGSGNKYGTFPYFAARWNISDEDWMKWSKKWLSMLAIRPTIGIYGNGNIGSNNQYNRYGSSGKYNGHDVIVPENLSLQSIKWERSTIWNIGFNIGFLDDLITAELEIYGKRTKDLLISNIRIPSANGFSSLAMINGGQMYNKGWELNISTAKFAKVGKFSMKARLNFSQNFNEIEELNSLYLESVNGSESWQPTNQSWNRRVQIGNALGSIYGLHYKGVYRYDYEHNGYDLNSWTSYGYNETLQNGSETRRANNYMEFNELVKNGWTPTGYNNARYNENKKEWEYYNPTNTAAAAQRRGENNTCPIAYDKAGNMLTDQKGNPLPMYYVYNNDGGTRYQFSGGDAIYEDINHDGQIDRYDMVYLGNSNPRFFGGGGFTLFYGKFSMNVGLNFRVGSMVINNARATYESMHDNNNQSYATTWRWRKNGDITQMPRAINYYGTGVQSYNSLPSDRYVESGDFLRIQYIQFKYDFEPKKINFLKKCGVKVLGLSASINNIACFSSYTGVDPEVSPNGFNPAIDNAKVPRSRSFTCSVNLGF